MKKLFSILFLSVFFVSTSLAQHNYAQELVNLMQAGRCFEAREFYMQNTDKFPPNDKTLDIYYKSHMSLFFNKPDSAAIYLEDLLANHELVIGPVIGSYYGRLLQFYDEAQRFEEGINLCDKFFDYLKRNPFDLEQDFIHKEFDFVEKVKSSLKKRELNEPRIKIERSEYDAHQDTPIRFNGGNNILFDARYNDITLQTFFDTGVSDYFFLTKNLADKIGVKIIDTNQDSIKMVNGVQTKALRGIIDKVDLGNVKLYNLPVLVFKEPFYSHLPDTLNNITRSEVEKVLSNDQIIMGLPAMLLIGRIEFDWEKRTISFPKNTEDLKTNDLSNMCLIEKKPYLRLKVDGLPYMGYLDTGDNDFLCMRYSFYERNKNYIQIDSIPQKIPLSYHGMSGSFFNVPYELVKDPHIYLSGKQVNINDSKVIIADKFPFVNAFDGIIGVYFLFRIAPKVIIDFQNMRIEGRN